jgi:hypothetical protein
MVIENVKITDVSLSMADHDCLTFDIAIKGNGFGCAIHHTTVNMYLEAKMICVKL